jgi:hypothetical protein
MGHELAAPIQLVHQGGDFHEIGPSSSDNNNLNFRRWGRLRVNRHGA